MGELERLDQPLFNSQEAFSHMSGPHQVWPYLRTSRMKTKPLLTKMCFVLEMAAVPVMENCSDSCAYTGLPRDPGEPMHPALFPKEVGFMIKGSIAKHSKQK